MFANHLYFDEIWDRDDDEVKFRWKVDGRDRITGQPISTSATSRACSGT